MGTWEIIDSFFQKLSWFTPIVPNLVFLANHYPEIKGVGKMTCLNPTGTLKRPRLIGLKVEYFCYRRKDYLDVFVEKMNKILDDFANFRRQKIDLTDVEKREQKGKTICYLRWEKFNRNVRNFIKSKTIVTAQENIEVLPIEYII